MTVKDKVMALLKADGTKTTTAEETASELGSFFSSVFIKEPYRPLPQKCYQYSSQSQQSPGITAPTVSFTDIQRSLLKLNIYKSPGPDNINPLITSKPSKWKN